MRRSKSSLRGKTETDNQYTEPNTTVDNEMKIKINSIASDKAHRESIYHKKGVFIVFISFTKSMKKTRSSEQLFPLRKKFNKNRLVAGGELLLEAGSGGAGNLTIEKDVI